MPPQPNAYRHSQSQQTGGHPSRPVAVTATAGIRKRRAGLSGDNGTFVRSEEGAGRRRHSVRGVMCGWHSGMTHG